MSIGPEDEAAAQLSGVAVLCCDGSVSWKDTAGLAEENSRDCRKTGNGGFGRRSISERPLRFFGEGFDGTALPPFGGLPRFLGRTSTPSVSVNAEPAVFFGLPRGLGALFTTAVVPAAVGRGVACATLVRT